MRAHAGIRDNDPQDVLEDRLEATLGEGTDKAWLRQRLRALLGLPAPEASREENFTAWMRFLEDAAAVEPVVLVFEDLHWADDGLLAFLEHLITHAASVPLLVVGTCRRSFRTSLRLCLGRGRRSHQPWGAVAHRDSLL